MAPVPVLRRRSGLAPSALCPGPSAAQGTPTQVGCEGVKDSAKRVAAGGCSPFTYYCTPDGAPFHVWQTCRGQEVFNPSTGDCAE